jgi:hypothetical protein
MTTIVTARASVFLNALVFVACSSSTSQDGGTGGTEYADGAATNDPRCPPRFIDAEYKCGTNASSCTPVGFSCAYPDVYGVTAGFECSPYPPSAEAGVDAGVGYWRCSQ